MMGDNNYNNSMSSFYRSKLNKKPEETQAQDPIEAAMNNSMTPQIDFGSATLAEQAPVQETKDIVAEKVGASDLGLKQLPEAQFEPSQGDKAIKTASTAAKASGNPKAQAAAAVLDTATAIYQANQQQKMNRYNAEIAKINARQNAISNMANLGAGLKA
jgi:hypothetical protein